MIHLSIVLDSIVPIQSYSNVLVVFFRRIILAQFDKKSFIEFLKMYHFDFSFIELRTLVEEWSKYIYSKLHTLVEEWNKYIYLTFTDDED